ncbi:TetR/AcrR family transcriptional regulator [Photobacterium carnosum]|uniref:TetR/AcrR family transcriptional regulator n=1 Tax=Photobacterium carnosum TaxID=2023717 RepID=UPI001C8FB6F4|nr:TetR/AcrR family transcriptional regulator [Photobacterium carnosum]MBY3787457.1 TetR/AcrR family transcriptional regulator [Photobacterium carnosum]MCD9498085.1 TetR family transcriptional regulator [Photobacterium carnosum]MCD9521931.1 TetR family transcriptional regulator [Photobacterium carnosum]MCD9529727.1 TetR family transcriptional regulator [Photobacterium carnosum]MCD9532089.1 TetR family transcriptional regulator [Photobacterium carnosum]
MKQTERKHLAIIEAAKEEFITHGFLASNMDRISTEAAVSKRTLYRHFESKEVLFVSVLTIIQESVSENVKYEFDPTKTLTEQLTVITCREADILYSTYGIPLSRTIVMEFLRQPELALNLIKDLYSTKAITDWFQQAIAAGCMVDKNIMLLTNIYISLFQGLLFWPQVMNISPNSEGKELEDNIETIVSVFLASHMIKELA